MNDVTLPTVLFVGPPRTGTSWVWQYLLSRGDVVLPQGVKETWFFSSMFDRGIDWYASHFRRKDRSSLAVEVDPTLFSHDEAPGRVVGTLGSQIRIIVTVRDPVARSWSHYMHARRYGWTAKPLEQAIDEIPAIIEGSRYSKHLGRWFAAVGSQYVSVLSYEMLRRDPLGFAKSICSAMRLPYVAVPEALLAEKVNRSRGKARIAWLVRVVTKVTVWLRSWRLYSIMDFGRGVGLQRLLYRDLSGTDILGPEDERFLREVLSEEYIFLKSLKCLEGGVAAGR